MEMQPVYFPKSQTLHQLYDIKIQKIILFIATSVKISNTKLSNYSHDQAHGVFNIRSNVLVYSNRVISDDPSALMIPAADESQEVSNGIL